MFDSKGASDYFSHILALVIAIVILSVVTSTFYEYYHGKAMSSQDIEARRIMSDIESGVIDVFSEYGERDFDNLGEEEAVVRKRLGMPESIGGNDYEASLVSQNGGYILVNVSGVNGKSYNRSLYNIDVGLEGSVEGPSEARLEYIESEDLIRLSSA